MTFPSVLLSKFCRTQHRLSPCTGNLLASSPPATQGEAFALTKASRESLFYRVVAWFCLTIVNSGMTWHALSATIMTTWSTPPKQCLLYQSITKSNFWPTGSSFYLNQICKECLQPLSWSLSKWLSRSDAMKGNNTAACLPKTKWNASRLFQNLA